MYINIPRNRPIATVLREYCESRKGKVVSSRNELHRRFPGLDWNIQKKIISLHLQRTKTEREWAYKTLLHYWDDSFAPLIEKLWTEYHEPRCSWLVSRYLSEEFINANMESLCQIDDRNYFFIAIHLGHNQCFHIDRSKLSTSEYLSLLRILGKECTPEDALSLFKEIAVRACKDERTAFEVAVSQTRRMDKIHPDLLPELRKAFYDIDEMKVQPAVDKINEWGMKVMSDAMKSEEWNELQRKPLRDFEYNIEACQILLRYIRLNLGIPDDTEKTVEEPHVETKQCIEENKEILNHMLRDNPNISSLVDALGLQIAGEELPF